MDSIQCLSAYPFLYETHLHTAQSSACARCDGAEMARACRKAGYAGIFVTDHNWGGNTRISPALPWREWVEEFSQGFRQAEGEGERLGLDVFFAYEAGYEGTEFLIYGITPEWLSAHPQMRGASVEEQYALIHEAGGMVIHAHPFREEYYIPRIRLFPEFVDGVEAVNATHSNPRSMSHNDASFDERAVDYARKHRLPMTAGSDIHTTSLLYGGVAFRHRLSSPQDYVRAVTGGEDYVLTNGEDWFDRSGMRLGEVRYSRS